MKISRVSAWQVPLPLREPYWLSGGRLRFDALDSTLVCVETDSGIEGWGEACPWGHTYLPAYGQGVRSALELLAPVVLGRDPRSIEAINRLMDVQLPGHWYAKSPLDIACWDIVGKAIQMPLWQLFGGERADPVALNSSISTGNPEEMLALISQASKDGYRTHSAKIGGSDISTDIARINTISDSISESESVTFDVNRAWTPGVAVQVLNSVLSRDWIEQPCETLEQCQQVALRVPQPIMLDECLHSFSDHLQAWKMGACEGVKVKPNRVGGLTRAKQIRDFGISVGWRMHIEDVGGSVLADTAAIHLASSTPTEHRLASWLCHYHLSIDPFPDQGARNQQGFATPPSGDGLGVCPDRELLGKPYKVWEKV